MRQQYLKKEYGFSLLEVLVSLVVLSIGLLGLARLQSLTMIYNHTSHLRSIAITQTRSIIDRMQANQIGINLGNYDNVTGIPTIPPVCTNCAAGQIATIDRFEWNTDNAAFLPLGQGTIVKNGNVFTITIMWDNNKTGATGTNCSGNPTVDLTCYIVGVEI